MKFAYTYSWLLREGDLAQVQQIIEAVRKRAKELGGDVGELILLLDEDAQAVQPEAYQLVMFVTTIPGSSEGRFGLATSDDGSWTWRGAVLTTNVKTISELSSTAIELGLEVSEVFAGMVITSMLNGAGVVETVQRQAFDPSTF